MCLWYGGTNRHSSLVTVLPIGMPLEAAAAAKSSSSSNPEELEVKRSLLLPLDEEVLHSRCSDSLLRDFGLALVLFAEWDDYARDSYVWPEFIARVMGSKVSLDCWFKMSSMHPLANRSGTQESRVHFFFFLLCAEQRGLNGEYMATDRFVRGERQDSCSREVLDLVTRISELASSHSGLATRNTSRAGKQYQAGMGMSKLSKDGGRLQPADGEDSGSDPVWNPQLLPAGQLAAFVEAVAGALRASVRVGQLLEAPTVEWMCRQQGSEMALAEAANDLLQVGADQGTLSSVSCVSSASPELTPPPSAPASETASGTTAVSAASVAASDVLNTTSTLSAGDATSTATAAESEEGEGEGAASSGEAVAYSGMDVVTEERELKGTFSTNTKDRSPVAPKPKSAKRSITCVVVHLGKIVSAAAAGPGVALEPLVAVPEEEPAASASSAAEAQPEVQIEVEEVALEPLALLPGEYEDLELEPLPLFPMVAELLPGEPAESGAGEAVVVEPVLAGVPPARAPSPAPALARAASPVVPALVPAPVVECSYDEAPDELGRWVTVYDGREQWSVPLSKCRTYNMSEDAALRLLSVHECRVADALAEVHAMLGAEKGKGGDLLSNAAGFTRADLDAFLQIAQRHPNNIRKVWMRFNQRNDALGAKDEEKASDKGAKGGGKVPPRADDSGKSRATLAEKRKSPFSARIVTLREITSLFLLVFQGFGDGDEAGGSSAYDARTLSRHTQSTRYNEHWGGARDGSADKRVAQELAKFRMSAHDLMHIYARTFHQVNCWPASFPMNKYNVYWLRSNDQPCVCLDFDPEKQLVTIVPICSATYHHEMQIHVNNICPISAHLLKVCPDERAASFAMAIMDFAKWELSTVEVPLCRWYRFPTFIMRFLAHGPTFSSWRKTAERVVRGSGVDKRKAYFDKLVEDYIIDNKDESERLNVLHMFPFADTSNSSGDESEGASSDDEEAAAARKERKDGKKRERKEKRDKKDKDKEDDAEEPKKKRVRVQKEKEPKPEPEPEPEPQCPPANEYNLFWSPKSNLPCLFYDRVQNLHQWTISVIPMCCTTYHYRITALRTSGQLESLTRKHMDQCTDERTADFTFAMMDFADWHRSRMERAVALGAPPMSNDVAVWGNAHSVVDGVYIWPRFIAEMVEKPKLWALWRKKAERANSTGTRRLAYLTALCSDFQEFSAEYASQPTAYREVQDIRPDKPGPRETLGGAKALPKPKKALPKAADKGDKGDRDKDGDKDKERKQKMQKMQKKEKKGKSATEKNTSSGDVNGDIYSKHSASSSSAMPVPVHTLIFGRAGEAFGTSSGTDDGGGDGGDGDGISLSDEEAGLG